MSPPFVVSRELDAPQASVWAAWTESDHLAQWFGPKGSRIVASTLDFRPGGRWHYALEVMGAPMWGIWEFVDVAAPERFSIVQGFSDAEGGVTRHPMAPLWPLKTFSTLTLAPHGAKTLVTLTALPHEATPAEAALFAASHAAMAAGWTGSFEALDDHLKTRVAPGR